jgi:hypothetical protein
MAADLEGMVRTDSQPFERYHSVSATLENKTDPSLETRPGSHGAALAALPGSGLGF